MNRERIAGRWKQLKGIARQQWGWMIADDAGVLAGRREQMLGRIQAAHGLTTEAGEKQLAEWLAERHKVDPIHK